MSREVQKHGLIWERELCLLYGMTAAEYEATGYTAKMDLCAEHNRVTGVDTSIKAAAAKRNTVDMANPIRVFDAVTSGKPYHMIVVLFEQRGTEKHVKRIVELNLTGAKEELFGSITREQLVELDAAVKKVPQKRKPTPEEHSAIYTIRNALLAAGGDLLITIKCDSTQSRIQSSLNGFSKFLANHPERVVAQSDSPLWRGGAVTESIVSGRRVMKANAKPPAPSS